MCLFMSPTRLPQAKPIIPAPRHRCSAYMQCFYHTPLPRTPENANACIIPQRKAVLEHSGIVIIRLSSRKWALHCPSLVHISFSTPIESVQVGYGGHLILAMWVAIHRTGLELMPTTESVSPDPQRKTKKGNDKLTSELEARISPSPHGTDSCIPWDWSQSDGYDHHQQSLDL